MSVFFDTVNRKHPMGAARIVRRERFAWPGGYEMALLLDDGALLCADCVRAEYHQISYSYRTRQRDGWRPAGLVILDGDEAERCAHCDTLLGE